MIVVFDSGIWISALNFAGLPLQAIKHGFLRAVGSYQGIRVITVRRYLEQGGALL